MEDVMGGKDAWANVDKTDGKLQSVSLLSRRSAKGLPQRFRDDRDRGGPLNFCRSPLTLNTIAQCPREGCDGSQAFFYQVQIRSADEPMTTFLKVGLC